MQDRFSEQNVKMTNQLLFTTLLNDRHRPRGDITKGKEQPPCPLPTYPGQGLLHHCLGQTQAQADLHLPMPSTRQGCPQPCWDTGLGFGASSEMPTCPLAGAASQQGIETTEPGATYLHTIRKTPQFCPIQQNPKSCCPWGILYLGPSVSILTVPLTVPRA